MSSLFANISTTSWPNWTPASSSASQSIAASGYNEAAYSALWQNANPLNFTRGLYTSTASPTTVPTSALQAPPNLYFSPETCYPFPRDFVFGAAGSASQCEGAVADQGKSPSFMDMLFTIFSIIGPLTNSVLSTAGQSTLESNYVSIEHYYLYKQDIDRLAAMGLKYYSFSISWTRILPFALPGTPVNSYGIQHYDDVINYALEKGLKPVVTITHFDTPLQFFAGGGSNYLAGLGADLTNTTYGIGGVTWGYNNETFVDAYVNYAKIALSHFADRVPYWITFNEPQLGTTNGQSVYNVLTAHAQAHHFYKEELKGTGKISMKMGITPAVPRDASNASDIKAANWFNDLYVGALLDPLALGEDYPDAYKLSVADYVPLSAEDLAYMNNTMGESNPHTTTGGGGLTLTLSRLRIDRWLQRSCRFGSRLEPHCLRHQPEGPSTYVCLDPTHFQKAENTDSNQIPLLHLGRNNYHIQLVNRLLSVWQRHRHPRTHGHSHATQLLLRHVEEAGLRL